MGWSLPCDPGAVDPHLQRGGAKCDQDLVQLSSLQPLRNRHPLPLWGLADPRPARSTPVTGCQRCKQHGSGRLYLETRLNQTAPDASRSLMLILCLQAVQ